MAAINDGGPAYPVPPGNVPSTGLTVRDVFAMRAMHALMTDVRVGSVLDETSVRQSTSRWRMIADMAYRCADAMLKARG